MIPATHGWTESNYFDHTVSWQYDGCHATTLTISFEDDWSASNAIWLDVIREPSQEELRQEAAEESFHLRLVAIASPVPGPIPEARVALPRDRLVHRPHGRRRLNRQAERMRNADH